MHQATYTIIIPSHNRPDLLPRALASALDQSLAPREVIIVDDGSNPPVQCFGDDRVKLVRLQQSLGGAAARNAGLAAATGRFVAFLDDDDELIPSFAARSVEALLQTKLPAPVAALSGIEVRAPDGRVVETRLPPTLLRGSHFGVAAIPPGRSHNTKQTLFIERSVLKGIGGFDEAFRSRVHSELFLRLNPICSLLGIDAVTYRLFRHPGTRVSENPLLRGRSFEQLINKHGKVMRQNPRGFARLLLDHSAMVRAQGDDRAAWWAIARAARLDPAMTAKTVIAQSVRRAGGVINGGNSR